MPPNMRHGVFTHFAMDTIDWSEKTTNGSTYHTTSSILTRSPTLADGCTQENRDSSGQRNVQPVSGKQTIDQMKQENIQSVALLLETGKNQEVSVM